jgi:hypothetical protein
MDVKEAVQRGALELANLMNVPPEHFLLEEAERFQEHGNTYWSITYSYPIRTEVVDLSSLSAVFGGKGREYKTIQFDDKTGDFKAIRMKTLAG